MKDIVFMKGEDYMNIRYLEGRYDYRDGRVWSYFDKKFLKVDKNSRYTFVVHPSGEAMYRFKKHKLDSTTIRVPKKELEYYDGDRYRRIP